MSRPNTNFAARAADQDVKSSEHISEANGADLSEKEMIGGREILVTASYYRRRTLPQLYEMLELYAKGQNDSGVIKPNFHDSNAERHQELRTSSEESVPLQASPVISESVPTFLAGGTAGLAAAVVEAVVGAGDTR